ncbi:replication factor A protein 1-like isoform X4 [Tasmannia lanceolata]
MEGRSYPPFAFINPSQTKWNIKCRVKHIYDIYNFDNPRSKGRLVKIVLTDEREEEILLLLFDENIERYRGILSEGSAYCIHDVVVKPNTQRCPITNHQYHLRPMRFTTVLPFDGDMIPITWKFPSLKSLCQATSSTTDLCDILGILVYVSKIHTIKTQNNFTFKKELVLIDDSNHPVLLTLWALKAHSVTEDMVHVPIFDTVLMVKAVKVVQYQGGSLSSTGYTTTTVNPINVGAERLLAWLEGNATARSLLKRIQSSSSPSSVASILPLAKKVNITQFYQHLQRDALTPTYYRITATLAQIRIGQLHCYSACVACKHKFVPSDNTNKCSFCEYGCDPPILSYTIKAEVVDETGTMDLRLFTDEAEHVLGLTALEFRTQVIEGDDISRFNRIFSPRLWKKYVFILSNLKGKLMITDTSDFIVHSIIDVDYSEESHALLHLIDAAAPEVGNDHSPIESVIESVTMHSSLPSSSTLSHDVQSSSSVIGVATHQSLIDTSTTLSSTASSITHSKNVLQSQLTNTEGDVLSSAEGRGKQKYHGSHTEQDSPCMEQDIISVHTHGENSAVESTIAESSIHASQRDDELHLGNVSEEG